MTQKDKIWIFLGSLFLIAFMVGTIISAIEFKMKVESYVTSTNETYSQNVEACRDAVNKANESASEEDKKKAVKEACIKDINSKSREAKILKSWGSSDLLKAE